MQLRILKRLIIIIIFVSIIFIFPTKVAGINNNIVILEKSNLEYLLYTKDNSNNSFNFAFSNNQNEDKNLLNYKTAAQDGNGNFVAYIDDESLINISNPIYIWAKVGSTFFMEGVELDLSNCIKETEVEKINLLTKTINVDTTKKETIETIVENATITATVGYIEILEQEEIYYILEKITDTNNILLIKLEELNEINVNGTIYERLEAYKEFYNLYITEQAKRVSEAWTKVEDNLKIFQPTTSFTGDKYIVWLKKITPTGDVLDIQFLISYREEERQFVENGNEQATLTGRLPITYDSIALIAILIIALIALVVVGIIRKRIKHGQKTNSKGE